jgi:phosphatidylglycerol---prolipoprotein diacylglyceryl transferase
MAGVLTICFVRGWFVTHRLQLYLIGYGLYRFGTEFIRPEAKLALGLTYYQYTSAVIVVGCALQWWWEIRASRSSWPK